MDIIQGTLSRKLHIHCIALIGISLVQSAVNLRAHLKTVHVKCQFKCNQCDNVKYNHSDHLREHLREVHAIIKDYACDQCDYRAKEVVGV